LAAPDPHTKIEYQSTTGFVRNIDMANALPLWDVGKNGIKPHPARDMQTVSVAKKALLVLGVALAILGIITLVAADMAGRAAMEKREHYGPAADPMRNNGLLELGLAVIWFSILGLAARKPFPALAVSTFSWC
jgi:hypothetical protein